MLVVDTTVEGDLNLLVSETEVEPFVESERTCGILLCILLQLCDIDYIVVVADAGVRTDIPFTEAVESGVEISSADIPVRRSDFV